MLMYYHNKFSYPFTFEPVLFMPRLSHVGSDCVKGSKPKKTQARLRLKRGEENHFDTCIEFDPNWQNLSATDFKVDTSDILDRIHLDALFKQKCKEEGKAPLDSSNPHMNVGILFIEILQNTFGYVLEDLSTRRTELDLLAQLPFLMTVLTIHTQKDQEKNHRITKAAAD
eukprot:TRINITY_DN5377_c0_g2_i1.p1 TRINITY_DN5377_c0_g2~~TRINITY_DN5377_c0_g2_i1.p1  ORF type:complete len:170 (-),score=16.12 TRINITY_DN5377_c0_g2_i1:259-768(-)